MNEFEQALLEAVNEDLKSLPEITQVDRDRLAGHLFEWLTLRARKRPIPNLAERLEDMRKRIQILADMVAFGWENGGLVVKVGGEADAVLRRLEHGTNWFEPYRNVRDEIAAVLLTE